MSPRGGPASGEPAAAAVLAFGEACGAGYAPGERDTVVLAASGGLDSTVLLHLARFAWPDGRAPRLVVAHFDHRMRVGSAADGRWLHGLCRAWGLEFAHGFAQNPPRSEADARAQRYGFLHDVRRRVGGSHIVTAHHADDQAETVLFRILRGTGAGGLRGIQRLREDGLWRPLLPLWREELVAYARARGLVWREDPTNEVLDYARNALRHRLLPDAEAMVAPGARRALVRFADQAAFDEEGWKSLMPGLLASLVVDRDANGVRVDRDMLLAHHPAVRARVLRALTAELGIIPDAEGTARAVDFAASSESGRTLQLGGGVVVRRELDRLAVVRPSVDPVPADRPLVIPGAAPGRGEALLAGRTVEVGWGDEVHFAGSVEHFYTDALRFPLSIRTWEQGDRMRTRHGVRKLKRVFLEARMPALERRRAPVLVDAAGEVLWIPGVTPAGSGVRARDARERDVLPIGVA